MKTAGPHTPFNGQTHIPLAELEKTHYAGLTQPVEEPELPRNKVP